MADRAQLKAEILKTVIEFMQQTGEEDFARYDAARKAFPEMPSCLLIEAEMAIDDARDEQWWQSVERTIDGEVLNRAITGGACK